MAESPISSERIDGSRYAEAWVTCALTQLGFIRLSSNPAVMATAKSTSEAAGLLSRLVADAQHVYLDALPPPASEGGIASFSQILGHQQVTDAYLVMPAGIHDAVLVTFDRRLADVSGGLGRIGGF